jgi:hypothetical protein
MAKRSPGLPFSRALKRKVFELWTCVRGELRLNADKPFETYSQ